MISVIATCFIVPLSFSTTLSASATVVDVALVSPSRIFNSAAVAVTPSNIFSSAAVDVTPSKILSSAAVDVTFVPPISNVVTEISPATVAIPSASVIKSVSSVWPIVVPLTITLSTVKVVSVPKLVMLD